MINFFYLYKGDTINLKNKLGIDTIESFTQSVGGELGTISYSNCSGTSACTINLLVVLHFKIDHINLL